MPTYLDRYRLGECEQVWAELLALGAQIREPQLLDQAKAVARETMTRARANIELLVPRLTSLGYQFAHPDCVFVPPDEAIPGFLDLVERRAGLLPLSFRAWCEVVGEVNFMGSHPKLSTYVQTPSGQEIGMAFLSAFSKHGGTAPAGGDPARQSLAVTQRLLMEVTQRMKTGQPRSSEAEAGTRAIQEILQQLQRPPASPQGPDDSDPLVVEPYFGDLEDISEDDDGELAESSPYNVMIAPDIVQKTNHSGGEPYMISFPNPAIDAPFEAEDDKLTFIEYLRLSFRWGGFPGLRTSANPPREELAYLTEGLSPL
jgi:hypothetical protein